MTDNLKESLSALIDGEASEIEVHRLLRQFDSDQTLKPAWVGYLQIRAVAKGENILSTEQHLSLRGQISAAIGAEESYAMKPDLRVRGSRRYLAPVAGFAVAASLLVAVAVTFNVQTASNDTSPAASVAATSKAPAVTHPIEAESTPAVALAEQAGDQLELKELTEEQQRRLRVYMNQHEMMVRNPNVQTVTYEKPGGK